MCRASRYSCAGVAEHKDTWLTGCSARQACVQRGLEGAGCPLLVHTWCRVGWLPAWGVFEGMVVPPCMEESFQSLPWRLAVGLFFFFLNINFFIYFWLRWLFVAVRGLSLVVASGGYSS